MQCVEFSENLSLSVCPPEIFQYPTTSCFEEDQSGSNLGGGVVDDICYYPVTSSIKHPCFLLASFTLLKPAEPGLLPCRR